MKSRTAHDAIVMVHATRFRLCKLRSSAILRRDIGSEFAEKLMAQAKCWRGSRAEDHASTSHD